MYNVLPLIPERFDFKSVKLRRCERSYNIARNTCRSMPIAPFNLKILNPRLIPVDFTSQF